jgi:uncharacterized protein YlxW (UPF0749 family)
VSKKPWTATLATIETDITAQVEAMNDKVSERLGRLEKIADLLRTTLLWCWLKSLTLGLFMILGVTLGAWGLGHKLGNDIQELLAQRSELQQQVESLEQETADLKQTIARMQPETWGIRLVESEKGRFIVLPPGTEVKEDWILGENKVLKLE